MTFLPIVARELRVAARRRGTYWVRIGAALAVMVLGTWFFLIMQPQPAQEISLTLFGILTGGAVLSALLSGIRATADCLSEEKREGTLGLLFLTDLKGYDVVFGKLAATSLGALYGVIAVVPVLAIPLLMGGVTLSEFGRMALVALNTLFFSLAVGMVVSAMSRSGRKAAAATFLLLFAIAAGLPFCGAILEYSGRTRTLEPVCLWPSPGFTFAMAFDQNYRWKADEFWWSLAVVHGMAWSSLVAACIIAPRSWQDRPPGAQSLRWSERWQLWSYGDAEERRRFRGRLLAQNAFYWLAARARLKPAAVWTTLGVLGCGWAWGWAKWGHGWLNSVTYVLTGVFLNLLLKCWFAAEASRQLAEDRKQGALELILVTPLTVGEILHGQFLALRRQFLGPAALALAVFFIFMLGSLSDAAAEGEGARAFWVCLGCGSMLMLVADLVALYWVGMWQALTARNPNRAANGSVLRILVVPAGLWSLFYLVAILMLAFREYDLGWTLPLGLWFGLGLAADITFALSARHRLHTGFRLAAEQRSPSGPGFWRRVFGSPAHPQAGAGPPRESWQ